MSEVVRFPCVSVAFSAVARALAAGVLIILSLASASCSGEKKDSGVVTSGTTIAGQTTGNHTTTGSASQPEGEKIAFISDRDANFEIYVMNLDGTGVTRLTETRAREGEPVWSADGRRIAFESLRDGNAEVYVLNADGSGQMRLSRNEA